MALKIEPSSALDFMVVGENVAYEIDISDELDSNHVDLHSYKIYDKNSDEVTDKFSGGHIILNSIITFGIIGYAVGGYKLEFWITCAELLPDESTPDKFKFEMSVIIE